MKSLILGIVVIILVGIGGFFYRGVMQQTAEPVACPMDAMVCPDGSSIGRIPPTCQFAACPAGVSSGAGFSFSIPAGYVADENAYGADPHLLAALVKPSLSASVQHTIIIRRFPIGEEETANEVILAATRYQPADMQAEDFSRFETSLIDGREFRSTVIERFEAIVHSAYFLVRADDVIRFEIVEHDVMSWMDPNLDVESLPEHQALLELLSSIEVP